MQVFPRLRMQKISCMLLVRNMESFQRIERLIKDEILPDLDFSFFDTCA